MPPKLRPDHPGAAVTIRELDKTAGFVVAVDRQTGELRVEAFMPGASRAEDVQKLRDAHVDPTTVEAFEKRTSVDLLTKGRHSARAGSGRFRPRKPHEKLGTAASWKHGGNVHPALRP
jgi:hypothetical protein